MDGIICSDRSVKLDVTTVDLTKLTFLDDATYEFVGGGEATNGY